MKINFFLLLYIHKLFVPMNKTKDLIDIIRRNMTAFSTPLWLCPARRVHTDIPQPFSPIHPRNDDILIDVGIYGRVDDSNAAAYTRQLDIWTLRNYARKMVGTEIKLLKPSHIHSPLLIFLIFL